MSSVGSWLQFGNRMNKFKGSYFQDFADISGDLIVRNGGDAYLYSQSNLYMLGGDISMNGYVYCKGVVDLSGNSLSGSGDGGGGSLTTLSVVNVKNLNTSEFITTGGYANVGSYLIVTGTTTLNDTFTVNSTSTFSGHIDANDASFNNISFANTELKGNIIPDTDAAYDIGSADRKIRDLYVSDASIWIGDSNKLAIDNGKITMKKRKKGDSDIPKFIRDKIPFEDLNDKINSIKVFSDTYGLKGLTDELSSYSVSDWIKFANKKGSLNQHGFTKSNHTAYDIYDLANDFDSDDSGQWTTRTSNVINYPGAIEIGSNGSTQALDVTGMSILNGRVLLGSNTFTSNYLLDVHGSSRFNASVQVNGFTTLTNVNVHGTFSALQNVNVSGKIGVGTSASSTYQLDVNGKARMNNEVYFKKSILVGADVTTNSLTTNDASGASMYVETKMNAGVYPDISHNVVLDVPNTLFKGNDESVTTNTNYLEFDTAKRRIIPYVKDSNDNFVNGIAADATGWDLGGPGKYRFDKIHARDLNISDTTINIEDASGNKIGMSFDATTGAVNYTVVTKDTADASGETFVIKGVQTQKISSGGGTIDPALLEFTGLSFGDTFDSGINYDLTSTYTYNLTTTSYTGDGVSTFTDSAGAQGLNAFISATNEATLLGSLPTKESAVIRVGADDRADGGLNGIDTPGSKVDLTNKIISVSDDDGGTTLKFTLWGSDTELNATTTGNYLNYIELKNINMVSGTYFVAKTGGNLVYNNANEDYLKNADLNGVVNGDLFLYIDRSPGNNWTKIPVSLPASGSITTQMLSNQAVSDAKIATNAISESKIVDASITTNKIADNSITASKFKAGEINGTIFSDDAIDGVKISGNIDASKITGTFDGSVITDNTIVSSKIVDASITTAKIAFLGVSGDNLMESSVISSKIATDAVSTDKIQDGAITSSKLATGIIDSNNLIVDNIISSDKITSLEASKLTGSVNANQIPSNIDGAKLLNSSVTLSKIDPAVLTGKQNSLTAGEGINIFTNNSGNLEIKSTVTNEISTGEITLDKIDSSVFSNLQSKLTAGSGININNTTNTISAVTSLSDNSVKTQHIQDGAITSDKLALEISDTNTTTTTTTPGTFTGSYADPGVNSYTTDLGLKDAASRISSDGLTLVSCSLRNTTSDNRFNIQKRPSVSHSWPLKDTSNNISFAGSIKHDFDVDSSGKTLVYLDNNTSRQLGIYDVSENELLRSYSMKENLPVTVELDASGNKMALYSHELAGYRSIDIYSVDKTNPVYTNNYIIVNGNNVLYTVNGSWTTSQTSVLDIVNKVHRTSNGLWMAVGEGVSHNVATSTDGINWTGKGKIFNIKGNSVYYNEGVWVAVGEDTDNTKNIAFSTDNGSTWSNPTVTLYSSHANDVIFAFDRWFACGSNYNVFWSMDGTTWSTSNKVAVHTGTVEVYSLSIVGVKLYAPGRNRNNYNYNSYWIQSNISSYGGNTIVFKNIISNNKPLDNVGIHTRKIVFGNGLYVAVGFGGSGTDIAQIAYSTTGLNNTWTQIKIFTGTGLDIIFDGAKFIAMGEDVDREKRIQVSYDGSSWNEFKMNQIPYSGKITDIINLSTPNRLAYSTDHGNTWTASSNNAFNVSTNKTHYSKQLGLWMAVGEGGSHTVATSTDGINWTGKGMVFNIRGKSVYYTAGVWVAVGEDTDSIKNVAFSTDNGSTWSNPTVSLFTSHGNDVIFSLGRWFVAGSGNKAFWSYDGTTWSITNMELMSHIEEINSLNYLNNQLYLASRSITSQYKYMASYLYLNPANGTIAKSQPVVEIFGINVDGYKVTTYQNILVNKIHYANGYYIAVGFGGTTSADAVGDKIGGVNVAISTNFANNTWTRHRIFTGKGLDITHDGSKWIATGEDSDPAKRVQYSTDNGATWQPLITPTIDASLNVTSLVSISNTNKTLTSVDYGENWVVNANSVFSGSINKTHYSKQLGLWMAVGEGGSHTVATSTDGINWTGKGMVFNIRGKSVYYTAGVWVAVGEDTDSIKNVAFSTDNGSTWSNPTVSLFYSHCNDVIFSLGRWFVVGSSNKAYWSYDGTTWSTTNVNNMSHIEEINSLNYIDGRLYVPSRAIPSQYKYMAGYLYLNTNGDITISQLSIGVFDTKVDGNSYTTSQNILINDIHYANGYYIAVGFGGTTAADAVGDKIGGVNIAISTNFADNTWTRHRIFTGRGLSITYDGSKWIATGEDSDPAKRVQYSTDNGATWQPLTIPTVDISSNITSMMSISNTNNTIISTDNSLNWIVNTNSVFSGSINKTHYSTELGLWMAVGEGGSHTVATSTDGINWTGKGMVFNIRGKSVYYTAGVWVAVGEDTDSIKNVAFSTDNGSTWSNPTVSLFTSHCNDVIFSLGRWFIVGYSHKVYWSYDGTTWSTSNFKAMQFIEEINSLNYIDGRLYVPSRSIPSQYKYMAGYLSLNPANGSLLSATAAIGIFDTKVDGNSYTTSQTILINDIHYANGHYIAVGFGGTTAADAVGDKIGGVNISISTSFADNTWTRHRIFTGRGLNITHDGSKWIATGEDSDPVKRVQYSTDNGATWQPLTMPTVDISANITNIISVSDTNKTLTSVDYGENWTTASNSVFSGSINKTHYSKQLGLWMAVGEGGSHTVATSTDGINWTGKGMVFDTRGKSVYYTNGVWVAVGEDTDSIKNVAFSTDNGSTWSNPTVSLFNTHGNDVTYSLGRWFVVGSGNKAFWSYDGTTWSNTNFKAMSHIEEMKSLNYIDGRLYLPSRSSTTQWGYISSYLYLYDGILTQVQPNDNVFDRYVDGTQTMPYNDILINKIHYASGHYIAVGFGGTHSGDAVGDKIGGVNISISTSFANNTWTRHRIFTGKGLDITHDGSKWIATGEHTDPTRRVQYSTDNGATWQPLTMPTVLDSANNVTNLITVYSNPDIEHYSIVYDNNDRNNIGYYNSPVSDTSIFSQGLETTVKSSVTSFSKVNAVGMGTGSNTISYSRDGGLTLNGLGNSIFSVAGIRSHHNGEMWVAVGEGSVNTLAISTDGVNWTGKGKIFNVRGKSVTYDNGMWVAVGEDTTSNKCIAYSTNDGATWSYSTSSIFSTSCNDIVHTEYQGWIAVGTGTVNTMATSADGISWTGAGLIMTTSINTIAYRGGGHILIGGNDTDKTRCFLYTTYLPPTPYTVNHLGVQKSDPYDPDVLVPLPTTWSKYTNFQGWTEVERIAFYDQKWTITSDGSIDTFSFSTNGTTTWTDKAKLTQDIKCKGIAMGPSHWIAWGEDTNEAEKLKMSTDNGLTWSNINKSTHDSYNDIFIASKPKKLFTLPLYNYLVDKYIQYSSLSTADNGYYHTLFKIAYSGDGTSIAISNSYLMGVVQVFKLDFNTHKYNLEYEMYGAGTQYNLGRAISLNYDGTVLAYSYGSHNEDTDTTQISRVVIYSKDSVTGEWNTIPDVTLKGTDFYEYSDFIPVRKFIEGFGSTVTLSSDGKTLAVASWKDYTWVAMRVFKRRSGVWLPYYTDIQGSTLEFTNNTVINEIDITENGQMIAWNAGDVTSVATIPNDVIYTDVKLAPMSGATAYLKVGQDTTAYDSEYGLNSDWVNAVEANGRIYSYPNSATLTHSKEFAIQSRNHLSFYTGMDLIETPLANDNNNTRLRMYIDNSGLVGIGKKASIHQLDVSGTINASNGIYSSGNIVHTSDDRLKVDEELINDALGTIMKITPEIYNKKLSLIDSNESSYRKESGLIAQDLWYNSPELRHLIQLGTKTLGTKTVEEEVKVPLNTLSSNVSRYTDEHGKEVYTVGGQVVSYDDIENEDKYKTIISQYQVPNVIQVEPNDIQDISLNNANIQDDPDYTSLGWGDTPASVNYNGLIPYLVKAIQEQQDTIDLLKTEISSLKNS